MYILDMDVAGRMAKASEALSDLPLEVGIPAFQSYRAEQSECALFGKEDAIQCKSVAMPIANCRSHLASRAHRDVA
jgi:hypothetical protein